MMDFEIQKYQEGIFRLNENIKADTNLPTIDITVSMQPVLKYMPGQDIVGMQLTLHYSYETEELLTFGFILNVKMEGWSAFAETSPDKADVVEQTYNAWSAVVNYGRGVLKGKLEGKYVYDLTVPIIPIETLKKNLVVLRFDRQDT